MLVELVSHCYCPPGLDQYAQQLRVQAASLIHNKPQLCDVRLTICYTQHDEATAQVIDELMTWNWPYTVELGLLLLDRSMLFRRAIGRNLRAKDTDADIIWMTDVDYFFGAQCFNDLVRVWEQQPLSMPAHILIHRDHETGDVELARMRKQSLPEADLSLFVERKQKICIGGVQIISGEWARRHGYLDGTRWVQPVGEEAGFRSCRCDKAFRSHNELSAVRLPIRGVHRLRHTRDGRDYRADGKQVGKEVW